MSTETKRLLVVSNRLPFNAKRLGETKWRLEHTVGGLVSGLSGIQDFETVWIGWAGVYVPDIAGQQSLRKKLEKKGCVPVFLTKKDVEKYYNGYSNEYLWPLLHNNGLPEPSTVASSDKQEEYFTRYKKVNKKFAKVVSEHYKEGEIVWVHDYHLMLLPGYLKSHYEDIKVGWFLHTAFPPYQMFQILPSVKELLQGIIGADLVGLHTSEYVDNFITTCSKLLKFEIVPGGMKDGQGTLIRVGNFPIGIDPGRFIDARKSQKVIRIMKKIKKYTKGKKIILGIDRLDPIKGIPQKLIAFEKFMDQNKELRHKVMLIQVAVPSRSQVPEYQRLERQVQQMSGRISGKFSRLSHNPIYLWNTSITFEDMVALYSVADAALITSLSDGMNLVSDEFVASQGSHKGVLILSEYAGAAEFLSGALKVNPWNTREVVEKIGEALKMPNKKRKYLHEQNFNSIKTHTATEWGKTFISALLEDQ